MTAVVTRHARQRTKDRLGLSKKLANKVADKALEHGVTHSDAKGHLKKYMDKIYLSHKNSNNIRIYNRKVFIFNNQVLITMFDLPSNLIKMSEKIQKDKNN